MFHMQLVHVFMGFSYIKKFGCLKKLLASAFLQAAKNNLPQFWEMDYAIPATAKRLGKSILPICR